jgi:hypothetical protein
MVSLRRPRVEIHLQTSLMHCLLMVDGTCVITWWSIDHWDCRLNAKCFSCCRREPIFSVSNWFREN